MTEAMPNKSHLLPTTELMKNESVFRDTRQQMKEYNVSSNKFSVLVLYLDSRNNENIDKQD